MEDELITRKDNCPWLKKEVCHIPDYKPCPDDCDLKDLPFEQDAILARMKEENDNIKKLKKEGMFKNREKIKDKIMGVYILEKCLKKHFDYTEAHIIDKDFEKPAPFPLKGWRRRYKK